MSTPEDVLNFWLDEVGPDGWYRSDDALDDQIREKFLSTWENLCQGAYSMWLSYPSGSLAYLIVADQFSRNMHRGSAKSYALDAAALAVSKIAVGKKWDMRINEPARQFFYLPMMHSECVSDQERCVRLLLTRMPETGASNLLHAKAHRDVIRQFGRFPFRNEALERRPTGPEISFMQGGGYGETVRRLSA